MQQCLSCDELKNTAYAKQVITRLTAHFEANPCVDCGEDDVRMMEFALDDTVWEMLKAQMPWVQVNRVIHQSTVVCANCNRLRLAKASGPWGIAARK